ncbi:Uncharacterised protein [Mycobacteroides abscessus subsp. abscessus]|nr:Uncharacterised protein [Mycobacteroides abscessus subsp. abscessus]
MHKDRFVGGGADFVAGSEDVDGGGDGGVEHLIIGFEFGEHADLATAVSGFGDRGCTGCDGQDDGAWTSVALLGRADGGGQALESGHDPGHIVDAGRRTGDTIAGDPDVAVGG